MAQAHWETLPIELAGLDELVVRGNGKDDVVIVRTTDGRRVEIPVSDGHVRVTSSGCVILETSGSGDSSLQVRLSGTDVSIRVARVDYPGSEQEWAQDLAAYTTPSPWRVGGWVVTSAEFVLDGPSGPS